MTLEGLDQAVFESKWQGAEETAVDIIATALELPPAAVERVLYAAKLLRAAKSHGQINDSMDDGPSIPLDLREAIKLAVEHGRRRAVVRWTIQNDAMLAVKPRALIGAEDSRICDGCQLSMRCVLESLSTPKSCAKKGPPVRLQEYGDNTKQLMRYDRGQAMTKPLRIRGDKVVVTCEHPRGTFEVDIKDVVP